MGAAVLATSLVVAGASLLARHLAWREDLGASFRRTLAGGELEPETPGRAEALFGPWAARLGLRSVLAVPFGGRSALFVASSSEEPPERVFAGLLRHWAREVGPEPAAGGGARGPVGSLDHTVTVGTLGGVAWLARLSPDLGRLDGRRLPLRGGLLLLAYPHPRGRFEYVAWGLPAGTDLARLGDGLAPAPDALARLAPDLGRGFEARLAAEPSSPGEGSTRMLLCRPTGDVRDPVATAAQALAKAGWRPQNPAGPDPAAGVTVMTRANETLWLTAAGPSGDGGWITILVTEAT